MMIKRPRISDEPRSASDDLVTRLKATANDTLLLREIVESHDSVSIAAAFAELLSDSSSPTTSVSERRKKARKRPCPSLPEKTFLEVVLFADRDSLDAMQLVCSFLLSFIRERELTQLALRAISHVRIGDDYDEDSGDSYTGWLPIIKMEYNRGAGKELTPKTVHQLASCLRMAFCESVLVDLWMIKERNAAFNDVWSMVFDDLVATSTFVGTLNVYLGDCEVELAVRAIVPFRSVQNVTIDSSETYSDAKPLGEAFFLPAAERGVRHIKHSDDITANTAAALSFGFAERESDRSLIGIDCGIGTDFLSQVQQKARELCKGCHVDFNFKLAAKCGVPPRIDSTGFEKYQREDVGTWLINDLDNHVNVEVKQTKNLVEIHVFSSV